MIELEANFGSVIEGLGAADAYLALDKNVEYYNAVVDFAFERADEAFNDLAAAYAEAGGNIGHMFEYGTLGVNRQRSNMRPQPTEERARLWKDMYINRGPKGGGSVAFEFKPSISTVPVPTVISQEVRAKIRERRFTWKARIMEENEPVHVALKNAQFLLIPYHPGAEGFRPNDIKRGYTLSKASYTAMPGRSSAGHFTSFCTKYWNRTGPMAMEKTLEEELQEDFLPYFAANPKAVVMPPSVTALVKARSQAIQREVAVKAKARRNRYGR